jgi:serine/threonine-protein kinase HipA
MDKKSLQKMFGTSTSPLVDLRLEDVSLQAQRVTGKLSISGVQPKLIVRLEKRKGVLLPAAEGEYILKPQTSRFPNIPENEQCCMDIAQAVGIDVPPHGLFRLKDKSFAYIVKRFDRKNGEKIHQEDFCQILEAKDKYMGSVEGIGRRLKEISSVPGLDVQLFFERVVFYFMIGNGDAHLKNYSIAYRQDGQVRFTPAYDIVCSKLVIPQEEDSALAVNGRKNDLKREDFDALAGYLDIPVKVRYGKFEGQLSRMAAIIGSSYIAKEKQRQFVEIIKERTSRLKLS